MLSNNVSQESVNCEGQGRLPFPFCCLLSAAAFFEKDMLDWSLLMVVVPLGISTEARTFFARTILRSEAESDRLGYMP